MGYLLQLLKYPAQNRHSDGFDPVYNSVAWYTLVIHSCSILIVEKLKATYKGLIIFHKCTINFLFTAVAFFCYKFSDALNTVSKWYLKRAKSFEKQWYFKPQDSKLSQMTPKKASVDLLDTKRVISDHVESFKIIRRQK